MAAQDLASVIGIDASGPLSVSSDAGSVTQQPMVALIQADRYLAAKAARLQKRRGLLFSKMIPAAAFPDSQTTGFGGLAGFDQPGGLW